MPLFGRKKRSDLQAKQPTKLGFFKKRKSLGKSQLSQTKTPYSSNLSNLSGKGKRRTPFTRNKNTLNQIHAPGRLTQTKPTKLKRILLVLLGLSLTGLTFWFVLFTDFFQINEFQIYEEGTQITSNLKLNEIASQQLLNQNLLFFNEEGLQTAILQNNPEYSTITTKKVFPHTVQIELEKYPLAANIIAIVSNTNGANVQKKYLVNTNGMIIMQNEENPELPYIKINTDKAFDLNSYPLEKEKLDYIIKLINLFEEKFGLKIVEATYIKKAREVHLLTEKEFVVWFDQNKSIISQIDKLKKALPKLDIYKTPLQYIDLRITGTNAEKVIYKTK